MVKLFLASHGHFASGLKSSAEILTGPCPRLTVFDAYTDDRNPEAVLDGYFASVPPEEQVIMLSDLYGGSVNSKMYTYLTRPNTFLVAGVNLGLVLALLLNEEEELSADALAGLVEESREALQLVRLEQEEPAADDNELF